MSARGETGHCGSIVVGPNFTRPGHRRANFAVTHKTTLGRLCPLRAICMRRRNFIVLIGAAAAWRVAAHAQQAAGGRRIAFLHPYVENDPEVLARVIAFREGLEV